MKVNVNPETVAEELRSLQCAACDMLDSISTISAIIDMWTGASISEEMLGGGVLVSSEKADKVG